MPELVLYGIRELAEQFLGSNLDIEVDHSALTAPPALLPPGQNSSVSDFRLDILPGSSAGFRLDLCKHSKAVWIFSRQSYLAWPWRFRPPPLLPVGSTVGPGPRTGLAGNNNNTLVSRCQRGSTTLIGPDPSDYSALIG